MTPTLNIEAVREWLTLLHLDCAGYSVVSSTGDWAGKSFKIDDPDYLEKITAYIADLDRRGKQGIYLRVPTLDSAPGRRERGSAVRSQSLPAFWLDMDIEGPGHKPGKAKRGEPEPLPLPKTERECREIVTDAGLPEPTLWLHSGGGLYPIWLFDEPIDLTAPDAVKEWQAIHHEWHAVVHRAAKARGLRYDTGTHDFARVLRIPGTVNRKVTDGYTQARFFHPEVSGGLLRADDVAGWLTAAAERWPAPAPGARSKPTTSKPLPAGEVRVGDDYDARTDIWNDLLLPAGWQYHSRTVGGGFSATRPGKDPHAGMSATVNVNNSNKVYVFSTDPQTGLPTHEPLSPFAVYTHLEHSGDFRAATKALAARGFGTQRTYTPPGPGDGIIPTKDGFVSSIDIPLGEAAEDAPADTEPQRQLVVRRLGGVKPKKVKWLDHMRIPMGALTLLAGRESIGKSTLSYDKVARVTRGTLPGDCYGTPRSVAIIGTEEDLEAMIVPRLMAAGADLNRVVQIEAIDAEGTFGTVTLPADVERMKKICADEDIAMIVIDPIMSLIHASLDTHKDRDVRQALEPLVRFASTTGVAVLGLIHVNKSSTTDPLNSIMGSRAFSAVVRSVLYCISDPESPEGEPGYLFGHAKSNLGPKQPSIKYQIDTHFIPIVDDDGVEDKILTSKIVWGEEDARTVEEIMETPKTERALGEVATKLLEWLEEQGQTVTLDEVKAGLPDIKEGTLRVNLARLVDKGKIASPARAHYVSLAPRRPAASRIQVTDRSGESRPHMWHVGLQRGEHPGCAECWKLSLSREEQAAMDRAEQEGQSADRDGG